MPHASEEEEAEEKLDTDDETDREDAADDDDDDGAPTQEAAATGSGELTGKQRRHLRALGHHLAPLVQLGKSGITDGVVSALDVALEQHELVKVRVGTESPISAKEAASDLAPRVRAGVAQTLGRTFLLYRRHPREPRIELPR